MPSSSIRTPIQVLALMYFIGLLLPGKQSFLLGLKTSHVAFSTRAWAIRRVGGCRSLSSSASSNEDTTTATTTTTAIPPWNHPTVSERVKSKRKNNRLRFRQHVNPLARRYQQATQLPLDWPSSVFHNHPQRPLFLDIGSAKGRFLMDACARDTRGQYNYLGLEIRPGIAELARQRIPQHHPDLVGRIDFIGCNANVDLHRLLQLYHQHTTTTATSSSSLQLLQTVTIQFPDPHFKASHAKRRVVTKSLIATIAKYMPPSGIVFLQSDVQSVLDDMRQRFREWDMYFVDSIANTTEYLEANILQIPTEREVSVLERGLPVFRCLFTRNETPFLPSKLPEPENQVTTRQDLEDEESSET